MIAYSELIQNAAQGVGMEAEEYRKLIDAYFEAATVQLSQGNDIMLHPAFGAMTLKEFGGVETGHGTSITKRRYTAFFKIEGPLRKRLRQSDEEYFAMLRAHGKDDLVESLIQQRIEQKKKR